MVLSKPSILLAFMWGACSTPAQQSPQNSTNPGAASRRESGSGTGTSAQAASLMGRYQCKLESETTATTQPCTIAQGAKGASPTLSMSGSSQIAGEIQVANFGFRFRGRLDDTSTEEVKGIFFEQGNNSYASVVVLPDGTLLRVTLSRL